MSSDVSIQPPLSAAPGEDVDAVSPMIRLSQQSFERDLTALLSKHPGKWVAYHGAEFLGLGATESDLFRRCLALGLNRGEFIVRGIEPAMDDSETTFGYTS